MEYNRGFSGGVHTAEARERIRLAHLGKPKSPEHRAKISAALKGKPKAYPVWNKGRMMPEVERLALSEKMKGRDCLSPEQRERQRKASSLAHKGVRWSKSRRLRLGYLLRASPLNEQRKENIRLAHQKLWTNPAYAQRRRRKLHAALFGRIKTPAHRKKLRAASRRLWMDATYARRMFRAWCRRPTKPEKRVQRVLSRYFPGEWKYVGNGKVVIGGKVPDFVNVNGKKAVIEVFGRYWHEPTDVAVRRRHFKRYGFKTIILWEDVTDRQIISKVEAVL